ncbi:MAG TPA: hypothetical protein VIV14_13075 [Gammaproteobacteria bacterium]
MPASFFGGQLISTSDDDRRFRQTLLNGGTLDGTRLLSPNSARMMSQDRSGPSVSVPGWFTDIFHRFVNSAVTE